MQFQDFDPAFVIVQELPELFEVKIFPPNWAAATYWPLADTAILFQMPEGELDNNDHIIP